MRSAAYLPKAGVKGTCVGNPIKEVVPCGVAGKYFPIIMYLPFWRLCCPEWIFSDFDSGFIENY